MALSYELVRIKDFEKTCFVGEGDEAPMSPVTESLVFSTIIIGMPEFTEANYREVFVRLQVMETLYGAPMKSAEGDISYSLDDIKRHIGLKTNATPYTKAKFNSEVGRILHERATEKLHAAEKEMANA